jgi:hypothetical protein
VQAAWRQSRAGTVAILALWALAALATIAVAAEIALQKRSAYLQATDQRRYSVLARAYAPFMTESLHPIYMFFFPPTAAERRQIGNAVCSIDEHGFREPGLARAQGRKLAFLLGGSVAFGLFASSNDATITSHLNRLQDEYFFVNAGVPGFTSTQELVRLAVELADHQPAVVIALDGWNDLTLAREPERIERQIPPGTPEAFPALEALLARRQSPWRRVLDEPWFPELALRLRGRDEEPAETPAVPAPRLAEAASRYARNHLRMAAVARSVGARFIAAFQPLATLHHNIDPRLKDADTAAAAFFDLAREQLGADVTPLDMTRVFDEHFSTIPVGVPTIEDDTIFVDNGHLYDRGNEIVAQHLWKAVRGPAGTQR